jgi:hypothetical protein
MSAHPLPLILGAIVAVAILATGAVVYLARKGYRATVTVEPKIAPGRPAPETGATS